MANPAVGELLPDGHVEVRDVASANRLHNKGNVGTPQTGNTLRLSLVEAAYEAGAGRLVVQRAGKDLSLGDLMEATARLGHRLESDALVYRDLRERGLVVRHAAGTSHFDVWPRGTSQGKPAYQTVCIAETDPVRAADLLGGAQGRIVVCVADTDGQVTYYEVAFDDPRGEIPPVASTKGHGTLLADRVLVTDATAVADYRREFLGQPQAAGLLLSLTEADTLRRRGLLVLPASFEARWDGDALLRDAGPVAADLRERGIVVRSGLRFGAHLRAYSKDPDQEHADWLVHCIGTSTLQWSDLARGVRLAHGVRKKFLVAIVQDDKPRYVHVRWFRP